MAPRVVVMGIGNLLKGDDGFGVRVVEALGQCDLPTDVECIDGGTGGPTLMVHFDEAEVLILIDAADLKSEPGTLRVFSLDDITANLSGLDGESETVSPGNLLDPPA